MMIFSLQSKLRRWNIRMIRELEEGSMVEHNLGNQAWSALVGTWMEDCKGRQWQTTLLLTCLERPLQVNYDLRAPSCRVWEKSGLHT